MRDSEHQIHLLIDGWSAPKWCKYLAIYSYFVNYNRDLKKYTISLKEIAIGTSSNK